MSVLLWFGIFVCWLIVGNMGYRFWTIMMGGDPGDTFGYGIALSGPLTWIMGWVVYSTR